MSEDVQQSKSKKPLKVNLEAIGRRLRLVGDTYRLHNIEATACVHGEVAVIMELTLDDAVT
jgi:hypothetical protein